jgi:hypothetical protein
MRRAASTLRLALFVSLPLAFGFSDEALLATASAEIIINPAKRPAQNFMRRGLVLNGIGEAYAPLGDGELPKCGPSAAQCELTTGADSAARVVIEFRVALVQRSKVNKPGVLGCRRLEPKTSWERSIYATAKWTIKYATLDEALSFEWNAIV